MSLSLSPCHEKAITDGGKCEATKEGKEEGENAEEKDEEEDLKKRY